jgi:hypothetical protein
MVCYSLVRLVGGYTAPFSNDSFPLVETPAGSLRLSMSAAEKPVLDYVLANTTSDIILDLPFGGGMRFATGRRESTFTTVSVQLRPPPPIQEEDLRRMEAHPPALVIAARGSHLCTLYGTEISGCVFPRSFGNATSLRRTFVCCSDRRLHSAPLPCGSDHRRLGIVEAG